MLIQDLGFIEPIGNIDRIAGGAEAGALVINVPIGVISLAAGEADGKINFVNSNVNATAFPKANSGAASAVATSVDGTGVKYDYAYDYGYYV